MYLLNNLSLKVNMAGHSQFKNIMHRKGAQDAKRSKMFEHFADGGHDGEEYDGDDGDDDDDYAEDDDDDGDDDDGDYDLDDHGQEGVEHAVVVCCCCCCC